jgi:type I restriction enzyme S subunit
MKKGYKRTEIGIIPVDWEIVTLDELTYKIGDGIHSTPKYSSDGEYFFVNGNNLTDGKIVISKETKKVSKEEFLIHKRILNNSTILLSINGTIGNIAFYNNEKIVLGKSAAYINLNEKIEKELLYQLLQTEFIEEYFNDELTGSTIKNLGLGSIRNTPIPLPPLPEQKAIAEVLSDTDNLIQALEKRIAKKRLIKQGAMQKLLTPKDDWEVKKLGEILKVRHGKSQKDVEDRNGQYPILGTGGLMGYANQFLYDRESVLIGRKGTIDKPRYMDIPFWTVDTLFYTEIFKYVSPKCLFYKFLQIDWYSYNEASGVPSLNAKTIENIEISLPPLEEQTHIATILSDMDSEIEALEKKRAKYQLLKQGLMQNLLTGKIRLI